MGWTVTDSFAAEPSNAQEAIRRLEARYEWLISTGQKRPWIFPWSSVAFVFVILYLMIDHRKSPLLRSLRLPVWLTCAVYSLWTIYTTRGRGPAAALGVGITSAWFILWSATILVFDDCQKDYMRIERRARVEDLMGEARKSDSVDIPARTGDDSNTAKSTAREAVPSMDKGRSEGIANGSFVDKDRSKTSQTYSTPTYVWQSYPSSSLVNRLDWVLDIFTTFRGVAWSWRSTGLPPLPQDVAADLSATSLDPNSKTPASKAPVRSFESPAAVVRFNLYIVARNYLIVDLIKALAAHDPWFWGYTETTRLPGYLPAFLHSSPIIIKSARLLICLAAMKFALEAIFAFGPIFFVGLFSMKTLGVRAEPWCHPDAFGSVDEIFDKGLGGWWGAFWHQTFRKGFQTPGDLLVATFGMEKRSIAAKMLKICVAFCLSGLLHACGSLTQTGDTQPWKPFCFFALQPVGIVVQMGTTAVLKQLGLHQRCPRRIRRWVNFVFAHFWMYHTAPLLVDDFGRGGVWLFEPVPFSLFRGLLRLGSSEDGTLQWRDCLPRWHTGTSWWQSGLVL